MDTDNTNPPPPPPNTALPRFTMELEFVSSLANPAYLQYLGTNFHHLLNPPESSDRNVNTKPRQQTQAQQQSESLTSSNNDAAKFARYLKYLLYWKKPEYSQFLTHPAATIRNLELLQNAAFCASVQHPDLQIRLAEGFAGAQIYVAPSAAGLELEQSEGVGEGGTSQEGELGVNPAATNGMGSATVGAMAVR